MVEYYLSFQKRAIRVLYNDECQLMKLRVCFDARINGVNSVQHESTAYEQP